MTAEELPQPTDAATAGTGATPAAKAPSQQELQAEVEHTRAELGVTIDALATQLSPAYQANRVKDSTLTAASDAATFLTGGGLPADDDGRARNVKVLFATAGAIAALVTLVVVRRVHRH